MSCYDTFMNAANYRKKTMRTLAEVLPPMKQLAQNATALLEVDIKNHWRIIMGEEWTKDITIHSVTINNRQRCLRVQALHIHPLVLRHESKDILKRINDYFGYDAIQKVVMERS